MSFLKVFNSCCPFLMAPTMDADGDDYVESMKDLDDKFDFELNDLADEKNKKYQQQRLDKYAMRTISNSMPNNNLNHNNSDSSNNNIAVEIDMMQENVSNMVVNDILNKIVY